MSLTGQHERQGIYAEITAPLTPVPVSTLCAVIGVRMNLYIRAGDGQPVLFLDREKPISRPDIERLESSGLRQALIATAEYDDYQRGLRDNLRGVMADVERPTLLRFEYLGEVARDTLRAAFESDNTDRMVQDARPICEHLVSLASEPTLVAYDMYAMLRHDYSTFAHSFHVAAYMAIAARRLITKNETLLHQMTVAALLHDLGKLRIPQFVLNKPEPLSPVEQRTVRQHPQVGYERLCERDDLTWDQLMVVYQHHERPDGRGYPVGITGPEIHPWARLCAVANMFDNRTTAKAYRPASKASEVLQFMNQVAGTALDREFTLAFSHMLRPEA